MKDVTWFHVWPFISVSSTGAGSQFVFLIGREPGHVFWPISRLGEAKLTHWQIFLYSQSKHEGQVKQHCEKINFYSCWCFIPTVIALQKAAVTLTSTHPLRAARLLPHQSVFVGIVILTAHHLERVWLQQTSFYSKHMWPGAGNRCENIGIISPKDIQRSGPWRPVQTPAEPTFIQSFH